MWQRTRCAESRSSKVVTTQAIEDSLEQAVQILAQLDPIIQNKLENNPMLFSQWENVRRVERARRPAKKAPSDGTDTGQQPQRVLQT